MTQVRIISTLQADDVKAALRGLAPKVQERVLRKGMRKGLKPLQDALRAGWRSAPYRGRPTHRRAIAAATQVDVRRAGKPGELQGRVGVMYGRKGGARAAGRQRVWHLLENGHRLMSGRRSEKSRKVVGFVAGAFRSQKIVRSMIGSTMRRVRDEVLDAARAALRGGGRGNR